MKKRFFALLLAALLLFTTACGSSNNSKEEVTENTTSLSVSVNENLLQQQINTHNESIFSFDNGWIYGQFWSDDGKSQFVKCRDDGSDWTVLDKGCAHFINIKDGWIYYMNKYSEDPKLDGIYKMRASGEDKKKLTKADGSMQILGDKIYYTDEDQPITEKTCHLFTMDLNGENKTKVLNKPVYYWFVFGDEILYQDDRDGETLHIYNITSDEDKKINEDISYNPIYDGEYIYYLKAEVSASAPQNDKEWEDFLKGQTLWRVKPDGTDAKQISSSYIPINTLVLTGRYIFFINHDDDDRVYRVDKNGDNLLMITQDKRCDGLAIFGDTLKYTVRDKNGYVKNNYFCKLDGSDAHPFKEY